MAKKKAKETQKPLYEYTTSDVEAAYKVFRNPDAEKFAALKEKLDTNGGYCPSREGQSIENRCMCKQFRERDSEGWCKCRLYYKEARTKKQAAAYKNATHEVNEKKEKELEKQMIKEEKAATVEE